MSNLPRHQFPQIDAAQAQKHVTHNEALIIIDALANAGILDRDLAAPPGSPAQGDCYVVAASPTGLWAGQAGKIAYYLDTGWRFYAPFTGTLIYVVDEAAELVWNGSTWTSLGGGGGGQANIQFKDEGTNLGTAGTATVVDFTGTGVTASRASNTVTVNIPGGGGGGAPTGADYFVGTVDGTLTAERLPTATATVSWDISTSGQFKANVIDDSITLAKMANMATASLIGRNTAATGDPEVLSAATVRTLLALSSTDNPTFANLTVSNLTVNGTTFTVNSTITTLDDPILGLGGDTAPGSDDGKDRGIEWRWHNGTSAKFGFAGWDRSAQEWVFIPDSTNTSEVMSGAIGIVRANLRADMAAVNGTPDATNKLLVNSSAVLFNNIGADVQAKLNKNAAADTASLLFQTGFSGRAEFGTTGDDDFHVKVSPDGSTFYEAIRADRTNGALRLPSGTDLQGGAEVITGQAATDSAAHRYARALCGFRNNGATATGAIVFKAGETTSFIMHAFNVFGDVHAAGANILSFLARGYRTTGAWSNTGIAHSGSLRPMVRWAVAPGGENCLILGDIATVWPTPCVFVDLAFLHHGSDLLDYAKNWSSSLVTDLSAYTQVSADLTATDDGSFAATGNPDWSATNLILTGQAGDPASPADGQVWYNTTADKIRGRENGVTVDLSAAGGGGVSDGNKLDIDVSGSGTLWKLRLGKIVAQATGAAIY